MKLYQLTVSGSSDIDGSIKLYSRKIYKTEEFALKDKDNFIKKCSSGEMINLDINHPYRINVLELELEDD